MSMQISVNYLADGGLHLCVRYGNKITQNVLLSTVLGQNVPAYIDVTLNEDVPQTMNSFHKVVDEAMKFIGKPTDNTIYNKTTNFGQFCFLTCPNYPKTPNEINNILDWAFTRP